ncbi:MAG: hypothetical protein QOC92_2322 [Acidimicrobiaceae bacterium]|jgi:hypothetical protein
MSLLVRDPELGGEPFYGDGEPSAQTPVAVLRPMLVLLGAAALGTAVLHAAFTPAHWAETWSHGLFFAVVAWLQVALAVAIVAHPSRRVFALGTLNIVVIATWVISRTAGAPFGPSAGVAEDIGVPDLLATALEAILVVGCVVLLWRSRGGRALRAVQGSRWLLATAVIGSVVVAAASTAALTPRYAGAHTHGGTVSTTGGVAADGHTHDGTGTAAVPVLTGNTPCEKTGPPASQGSLQDAEGHNHRGPVEQITIDRPTAVALQEQQALARGVALQYPTVAAAQAGGYHASTTYVPCIGAHYTNIGLVGAFDPAKPSELLFDGTKPDSKIVGLSYLVYHAGGAPAGFAGPNDHWHQHNASGGLCFSRTNGQAIGAEDVTQQECAAIGGIKRELPDIWMMHDWVVPGWECSWGVFAPECPELGGTVGADAWTT